MVQSSTVTARPFLKWAGGKRQLLPQIDQFLPAELGEGKLRRYAEPFVGSGAVFFHIVQSYPLAEFFIADINAELILVYRTIKIAVDALINALEKLQEHYLALSESKRKAFYYQQRERYNRERDVINYEEFEDTWIERSAQMIFFNRTCYNGLFRVNSHGEFNVPFGRYTNPTICDRDNLEAVSAVLQRTRIHYGHYRDCAQTIDAHSLVYFDPPYRPLSTTANFTAYSTHSFGDRSQLELADFYRQLDQSGAYLVLSNSDPRNADPNDDFLEAAYEGFRIERVQARRRINSRADKRGRVSELLILNY